MEIYVFLFLAVMMILLYLGWPHHIDIDVYETESDKVLRGMTFLVLADVHSRMIGDRQDDLVDLIQAENPDAILIAGDFFDKGDRNPYTVELLERIKDYPIYYALGNHERYMKKGLDPWIQKAEELGVHMLINSSVSLGNGIELIGLDDMDYLDEEDDPVEIVNHEKVEDEYAILLSHKPHFKELYEKMNVDLIISGHVHGGQWCIPFTKIGLYAPGQGIFPKYRRGAYPCGKATLYVSRGLAPMASFVPRLFNNPSVDRIVVKPSKTNI